MLQDVLEMLRWSRLAWLSGQPNNKQIDALLEVLLRGRGGFLLRSRNLGKALRRASDDSDHPLHGLLRSRLVRKGRAGWKGGKEGGREGGRQSWGNRKGKERWGESRAGGWGRV